MHCANWEGTSQLASSGSVHKRAHPFAQSPQLLDEPNISVANELEDSLGTPQCGLRTLVENLVILLVTGAHLVSRPPKCCLLYTSDAADE